MKSQARQVGGAIQAVGTTVNLQNSDIYNCSAQDGGGAIHITEVHILDAHDTLVESERQRT